MRTAFAARARDPARDAATLVALHAARAIAAMSAR
jgi:hypothetical protein